MEPVVARETKTHLAQWIKICVVVAAFLRISSSADAQHLMWNLEDQRKATCLYGTITVLATHHAIYYCGANWHPGEPAGGYCGIQHNGPRERRTIFSIWDTSPELHPAVTEADPDTVFGRFGGEGEGGHTHMVLPWKVGETFQFFVQKQPGETRDTTVARYSIREADAKEWRHLATITSPNGGHASVATVGGGLNSFLENFAGRDQTVPKLALYRLWLGSSVDTLVPLTRADGDGIWGQMHDAYFLAEGAPEKLDAVFRDVEKSYGKPVFGGRGEPLKPISAQALAPDVINALKALPRADAVHDKTDAPASGKTYILRSVASRKPLAIENGSIADGSKVVQDASSKTRVLWKLEKRGDFYQIVNTRNGLVLDAADPSAIAQKTASESPSQAWEFVKAGDAYHIKSKQNGQVLDVPGGSTKDGAVIIPYAMHKTPSPNQLWILTEVKK